MCVMLSHVVSSRVRHAEGSNVKYAMSCCVMDLRNLCDSVCGFVYKLCCGICFVFVGHVAMLFVVAGCRICTGRST